MQNILAEFGISGVKRDDHHGMVLRDVFQADHHHVVAEGSYNVRFFVQDIESLIFWLKAILHPQATGLPLTFNIEQHWQVLDQIVTHYRTPRGIETNEHRELLIVQK